MRKMLIALCVLGLTAPPFAAFGQLPPIPPLNPLPEADRETPVEEGVSAWFVELHGKPRAAGGSAAALQNEKKAFRDAAREADVTFRERFSYDGVWNGLSIETTEEGASRLSSLPAVRRVYPVVALSLPEIQPDPAPEVSTALTMTQADIARADLGLTGHGIRVAVMDTGVDYDHPDLGGCFGPGCRVEMGWDFVGDAYNNDSSDPAFNPVPVPDPLPDDCNGHGTHVAGIAGANGNVMGVAPGVTLRAYRVFGCAGSTSTDIMLAAMDQILADGADVVNISIGSAFQWPEYPTAQGVDRLVESGIVVVTSAGNSGANGAYSISAPGVGKHAIATASFVNLTLKSPLFTVSSDARQVPYNASNGGTAVPFSGSFPLARTGTTASVNDGCNAVAPAPGSLTGKIALIRRGTCGFHEKTVNAQAAGAIGVVLYNNAAGSITPNVTGPVPITVPVVAITAAEGAILDGRIAAGPASLTWTALTVSTPITNANLIASSSSYGMAPDLTLKPDIGAPGSSIRSTWPLEKNGYANLSGTSMASPHVVGAVALLLEARPGTPAPAVRSILQNSASPRLWWGNPILGFFDNVHRQGAGMLQMADAIRATTLVEPGKLSLGEFEPGSGARIATLTVHNSGASAVAWDLSHAPALATGGSTFAPGFFAGFATVSFNAPSVTVPAGGTATVQAAITPDPSLADRSQFGGWLVLTPQGGGPALRVPYSGFKGDYQSIQVLVPTVNGFPWLAKDIGGSFFNQPAGAAYTLKDGDLPFFIVHLEHQARRMEFEVREAASGKPVHPVFHNAIELDHVGRNSQATSFFSFSWDGTRLHSNGNKVKTKEVPNGQYVVVLKVLKALGDENNPAHWETWTSPVITLARP